MKLQVSIILIFSLFVMGCSEPVEKQDVSILTSASILGSWRLFNSYNNDTVVMKHKDQLLKAAQDNEILRQGIIISFFKDGTFTEIRGSGEYESGKWRSAAKGQTSFLIDSKPSDKLFISREAPNKSILHRINDSTHMNMDFVKSADPLLDYQEDPFYITNNFWRIKPLQLETNKQIEERLANYFKHLAYLLKSAKERKSKTVSFEFSQGIVKIYNGGIGIQSLTMLPKTWTNTYYDNVNVTTSYNMFKHYLETTSYKGASKGAWIDDDYDILLSMYGDIKQGRFQK